MNKITTATTAAVALSIALAGCTPTTEKAYTGTGQTTPTVWTGSPAPAHSNAGGEHGEGRPEGANLNAYIVANNIAEVPFNKDEPGTPKIEFPLPPDWAPAGDRTPDWAYGAIVYTKAADPENPQFMYAIASKLTGNVDPAKILELAPGQLNELPEFTPREAPHSDKVGGYDAIDYVGSYMWEGQRRLVGQQTIVIPGNDALFVLQINGEAPDGQGQPVVDAIKLMNEQTKITLPS